MPFIKPFSGVKAGDIYPTEFAVGDICPPELLAAAQADGAVDPAPVPKPGKAAKA